MKTSLYYRTRRDVDSRLRALLTNCIDCLCVWMSEALPGHNGRTGATGATGATGPPGRKVNDVDPDIDPDVDPDDDCEGPKGQ